MCLLETDELLCFLIPLKRRNTLVLTASDSSAPTLPECLLLGLIMDLEREMDWLWWVHFFPFIIIVEDISGPRVSWPSLECYVLSPLLNPNWQFTGNMKNLVHTECYAKQDCEGFLYFISTQLGISDGFISTNKGIKKLYIIWKFVLSKYIYIYKNLWSCRVVKTIGYRVDRQLYNGWVRLITT